MPDSTPTPPLTLTLRPFAVEDFHDLARGKHFLTLHYRRESMRRQLALALIAEVLDDLTASGVSLTDALKITVSRKNVPEGDKSRTPAGNRYSVHVEAAVVRLPDAAGFPEEIRAHFAPVNAGGGSGK